MTIKTNSHDITVQSVVSTNIRKDGKSYPAIKVIFDGAISSEDLAALTSGSISIGDSIHEGYNTLGEIAVTVGKITTAESERDAAEAEKKSALETIQILSGSEVLTKEEAQVQRNVIEEAVQSLDDETALTVISLFPEWEVGKTYTVGKKVRVGSTLYRCTQEHTTQEAWTVDDAAALWVAINETNAGTLEDPIPAVAGMEYKKDLYYIYNDVVYLCIRQDADEGTVLQFTPDQLVGNYFEVV